MQTGAPPRTILVVDDQYAIRKLVRKLLEAAGYSVILAANGAMGLDVFKQNQAAIALVLTDVVMPNMDGSDLAARVLEIDGQLPVLFMSGSNYPDCGCPCLAKPFGGSELLAGVKEVLQRAAE